MSKEIWENINGFRNYQISSFGRAKSFKGCTPKILKGGIRSGYLSVRLNNKNLTVHRLVAEYFVKGRTKKKRFVNHKDGNKLNNHYTNLEWGTDRHNKVHAKKMGLYPKGENHPKSKLTEKDVLNIRLLEGKLFQREIADKFGISQSTVKEILRREIWHHI